jgi:hypothetical protein
MRIILLVNLCPSVGNKSIPDGVFNVVSVEESASMMNAGISNRPDNSNHTILAEE